MKERRSSSPARMREVQRRARKLMQRRGWGYGKAMRAAGWMVAKAAGDDDRQ